ncbi:hypothetical protein P175DRAFT_0354491 [Aspergillus ochraceoroseus IBT 24754]|uniref:Uncharacterized protein n=1 Tax=Aspergillus ochraceoroseus IBT 24754 TaxID=1392256 RepID=A0A2T5LPJ9_9EURO|nr:uncharacterized protein P175DRAFT_0354491 [Aspergillus ochraceoroseus IBT 24754]PTU18210.1 hypothetical protein P175DRAFT_0354491 [Aspergillus ochraceoroseus IBT 24754]
MSRELIPNYWVVDELPYVASSWSSTGTRMRLTDRRDFRWLFFLVFIFGPLIIHRHLLEPYHLISTLVSRPNPNLFHRLIIFFFSIDCSPAPQIIRLRGQLYTNTSNFTLI